MRTGRVRVCSRERSVSVKGTAGFVLEIRSDRRAGRCVAKGATDHPISRLTLKRIVLDRGRPPNWVLERWREYAGSSAHRQPNLRKSGYHALTRVPVPATMKRV